jgi:hypothetical protein
MKAIHYNERSTMTGECRYFLTACGEVWGTSTPSAYSVRLDAVDAGAVQDEWKAVTCKRCLRVLRSRLGLRAHAYGR